MLEMQLDEGAADTAAAHHLQMLKYGRTVLVQDAAYMRVTGLLPNSPIWKYYPFAPDSCEVN